MRRLYIIVQSIFYSNKTNSIVNKKLQVESSILENFSKETFFLLTFRRVRIINFRSFAIPPSEARFQISAAGENLFTVCEAFLIFCDVVKKRIRKYLHCIPLEKQRIKDLD